MSDFITTKRAHARLPLHGLAGYVTATRAQIEAVFGTPEDLRLDFNLDDKVTTQWIAVWVEGEFTKTFATIYDYKRYDEKLGAPTMDEVYEWHIGGNIKSVQAVKVALGVAGE